jgi:hypothetical protein
LKGRKLRELSYYFQEDSYKSVDTTVLSEHITEGGIVDTTRPKYIVRHDVIDSYSVSHHHRQSPAIRFKKHLQGTDKLQDELVDSAKWVENTTPKYATSVIVPSNHHNHIERWLEEVDWKTEPWNARIYHEMWAAWLDAIERKQPFQAFTWWMQNNCSANAIYLQDDYPFIVKDIYLGYHGDRGPNGSRGNIRSFAKIGAKTVIGHTHSPGIEKGAYQVGTSSKLKLEYTRGPSSWLNTHCLIHPNGKRQLINIVWGDWRYQENLEWLLCLLGRLTTSSMEDGGWHNDVTTR